MGVWAMRQALPIQVRRQDGAGRVPGVPQDPGAEEESERHHRRGVPLAVRVTVKALIGITLRSERGSPDEITNTLWLP